MLSYIKCQTNIRWSSRDSNVLSAKTSELTSSITAVQVTRKRCINNKGKKIGHYPYEMRSDKTKFQKPFVAYQKE